MFLFWRFARTKVRREALCVQETRAEKGRDTDHVLIQLHPDKIKPSKTKSLIVSVCLSHSAVLNDEIRSSIQAICLSILSVVCQDRLGTVRQILVGKNRADRQTVPDKIINKVRPRTESRPGATPRLRTNSRHNHRPPETHARTSEKKRSLS